MRDGKIIVDSIHGDIALNKKEVAIINTATFQRLRKLKQLGMGHLTYPNATHTRFAHSLGVFKIMSRITDIPSLKIETEDRENLRLAALLHDVGHYPYSHLMERIDSVQLTEDFCDPKPLQRISKKNWYPDHEELGRYIIENQKDIRSALGGLNQAQLIGELFSRGKKSNQQLSKLIHSNLDMDRLDYLVRDSRGAGVPYGEIDINYILNSIRFSPKKIIGIDYKAITAIEQFLMARLFMYRSVYYHKTTFGFEEACRQLLKRLRHRSSYEEIPKDRTDILERAKTHKLYEFTDAMVDNIVRDAADDGDKLISALGKSIVTRNPPKLLGEIASFEMEDDKESAGRIFEYLCKTRILTLADRFGIQPGYFLYCSPKPIKMEDKSSLFDILPNGKYRITRREELIKVFPLAASEPTPVAHLNNSLVNRCLGLIFTIRRLYIVDSLITPAKKISQLKTEVSSWINESEATAMALKKQREKKVKARS